MDKILMIVCIIMTAMFMACAVVGFSPYVQAVMCMYICVCICMYICV
jgi:hypothetical protein